MSKATSCVVILFLLVISSWELRINVGSKMINLKGQSGNQKQGEDSNSVHAWMKVWKDYKEDSKQGTHGGNSTEVSEDVNSTHFWKSLKADTHEDSSQKPAKVAFKNGKLMKIPQDSVEDMMSTIVLTKIRNDIQEDKRQVASSTKMGSNQTTGVNGSSLRNGSKVNASVAKSQLSKAQK